jgi:hypothetical protein
MRNLIVVAIASLFVANTAFAASCADQAAEKKLAGAAKNSFMTKCEKDTAAAAPAASSCEEKAIDKNGKPLAGAAKAASIKKCEADAAPAAAAAPSCESKAIDKNGKPLAGAAKAASIKKCEADAKK